MGTAVVLVEGPRVVLVELGADRPPQRFLLDRDPERAALRWLDLRPIDLPVALVEAVHRLPPATRLAAGDPMVAGPLATRAGRSLAPATDAELRQARAQVWAPSIVYDRAFALVLARTALEQGLRSPEEVLIALAREEERLERALGREDRAAAAFVTVPETALATYQAAWTEARGVLRAHHTGLEHQVEELARRVVPNLAAVAGEKVAARLVAAAGGVAPLGKMTAARLQLLGSRRRPSPEHGPRFGVLYRGSRMEDVPVARRGAYARTLAALAAIAARADATTRRSVAEALVVRRDRRVDALRRGRA